MSSSLARSNTPSFWRRIFPAIRGVVGRAVGPRDLGGVPDGGVASVVSSLRTGFTYAFHVTLTAFILRIHGRTSRRRVVPLGGGHLAGQCAGAPPDAAASDGPGDAGDGVGWMFERTGRFLTWLSTPCFPELGLTAPRIWCPGGHWTPYAGSGWPSDTTRTATELLMEGLAEMAQAAVAHFERRLGHVVVPDRNNSAARSRRELPDELGMVTPVSEKVRLR